MLNGGFNLINFYQQTTPNKLVKTRYISGIVKTHKTVDNKTYIDALSPPLLNLTANNAVLVAVGIDNKKKRAYFTYKFIGKKATDNITKTDIPINFNEATI